MPLPVAHGLLGASVVAALSPADKARWRRSLLIGVCLAVCPDFDYALNWLRIAGGGWHHGFTHSLAFACLLGLVAAALSKDRSVRGVIVYSAAAGSHTLLDLLLTESRGVALLWPLTDARYKLNLPNPIDYSWRNDSLWATTVDVLKISVCELLIFAPLLLAVLLIKRRLAKRGASVAV